MASAAGAPRPVAFRAGNYGINPLFTKPVFHSNKTADGSNGLGRPSLRGGTVTSAHGTQTARKLAMSSTRRRRTDTTDVTTKAAELLSCAEF